MAEDKLDEIRDSDRDSMHILPLSILLVETPGLKRARLIKNARLESMVKMFEDEGTGSGQIDVESLSDEFGWPASPAHPDLVLIKKLSELPSYDVYSLRILLREHGIKLNDVSALRLSASKVDELSGYMTAFTHPLIAEIFGGEDIVIKDFSDIMALFRDPDIKRRGPGSRQCRKNWISSPRTFPGFLSGLAIFFFPCPTTGSDWTRSRR
jgi:hypothetical protein